jgi:branched-chain amino acid transport system substrate-binding protein
MEKQKVSRLGSVTCFGLIIALIVFSFFSGPGIKKALAADTIKIGGAVPLTGRFAAGGKELKLGYEQAEKDINAAGGIFVKSLGKKLPIELILIDDESDPTKTVSRLEKLYAMDKVLAYVGTYASTLNAAAAGIAEKNRCPIVASAFSGLTPHQQGYKYLFSPFVKTDEGVSLIFKVLETVPEAQRPTKIAIFAEKTDWGKELGIFAPRSAKKHGFQIVTHEEYGRTKDYSSLILAAKSAGAEVVLGVPTPPAAIGIAKQMKELDYNPKAIFFWRGAGTVAWSKNLGKDGDYACYVTNWDHNFRYPGCESLVSAIKSKTGRLPGCSVGYGYAIVEIIADAVKRAGALDRTDIRNALASTKDLMTVQGPIRMVREDGVMVCPPAIMQWQKGISEVVYHEEFKTAEFVYPMPKWQDR